MSPDPTIRNRRGASIRARSVLAILAMQVVTWPSNVSCQGDTPEFPPNYVSFAAYIGTGIYYDGTRSLYVLRIPFSYKARSEQEHLLGIKPTLKTTLGFYDSNPNDNYEFPDSVGIVTILPGVEFPILMTRNWRLAPFVDFGAGWDTDTDEVTPILGAGALSRAEFPWGERDFILWNRLVRSRDFATNDDDSQTFTQFAITTEVRTPAGRFLKQPADVGTYLKGEFHFHSLVIDTVGGDEVMINQRYEIGVTYGTVERSKLWRVPFPRLGLGYRFGGGFSSYRIIFSFAN